MSYLIIAEWDENFHPTKINNAQTLEEADILVDTLINEHGYVNAFHAPEPPTRDTRYIIVDPVVKTISIDDAELKDRLKAALNTHRYNVEVGGITVGGVPVQTDRESRANLIAARIKASEDALYTVKWKTSNGFVTLDATTITAAADAVADHVQLCYATEADIIDDIDAGLLTTEAGVIAAFDAVVIV